MCEFFYALSRSRFSRVQFSGSVKRGGAPPFLDSGVVVDGVLSERAITEDHRAYSLPPTDVVIAEVFLKYLHGSSLCFAAVTFTHSSCDVVNWMIIWRAHYPHKMDLALN